MRQLDFLQNYAKYFLGAARYVSMLVVAYLTLIVIITWIKHSFSIPLHYLFFARTYHLWTHSGICKICIFICIFYLLLQFDTRIRRHLIHKKKKNIFGIAFSWCNAKNKKNKKNSSHFLCLSVIESIHKNSCT